MPLVGHTAVHRIICAPNILTRSKLQMAQLLFPWSDFILHLRIAMRLQRIRCEGSSSPHTGFQNSHVCTQSSHRRCYRETYTRVTYVGDQVMRTQKPRWTWKGKVKRGTDAILGDSRRLALLFSMVGQWTLETQASVDYCQAA